MDPVARPRWAVTIVAVAAAVIFAGFVLASTPAPAPANPGLHLGPLWFLWGPPGNASGTTTPGCPSAVGHYCYSVEIAIDAGSSAGGPSYVSQMELVLEKTNGTPVPWPAAPGTDAVSLVAPGLTVVCAEYDTLTSSWTDVGNFTGALGAGFTVVTYTAGVGAAYGLSGDSLVYRGVSGAGGWAASAAFP